MAIQLYDKEVMLEDISFTYGGTSYIVTFDEFIATSDPLIYFIPIPHSEIETLDDVKNILFSDVHEEEERVYLENEYIGNVPNDLKIRAVFFTFDSSSSSKGLYLHIFSYKYDCKFEDQ